MKNENKDSKETNKLFIEFEKINSFIKGTEYFSTQQFSDINTNQIYDNEEKNLNLFPDSTEKSLQIPTGNIFIPNNNDSNTENEISLEDKVHIMQNINNNKIIEKKINKKLKKNESLFEIIYPSNDYYPDYTPSKTTRRKDNILAKIKRFFFNKHIIEELLNKNLVKVGSKKKLNKFPDSFVKNVTKNIENQNIWNMTLEEFLNFDKIFKTKDEMKDFKKNKSAIESPLVKKSKKLIELLNKKLYELYNECIRSDAFKNFVLKQRKEKDDTYAKKFEETAKNFLKHFSVKIL